jgi:hypothetical protein
MPPLRTLVARSTLALAIALASTRPLSAQQRTRIDVMPYFGYGHGVSGSHDVWLGGLSVGLRTEKWGIALAGQDWVTSLPCTSDPDPCDDPTSTTIGIERRIPGSLGAALIGGVDAGVFSVRGTHLIGGARFGAEQALGPVFLRIEGQAQKVFGMNVSTLGALLGVGFSFGGPRLPGR